MTSVTGGGLGVCAAGGTEQVGLFIRRTGRLSPLGGGWNILKEDTRKVWELLHLCTIIISCNKCHRYGNTGNVENQNTCKFASIQICIFLFFLFFPPLPVDFHADWFRPWRRFGGLHDLLD